MHRRLRTLGVALLRGLLPALVAALVLGLLAVSAPAQAARAVRVAEPGRAMWVWDRPDVDELVAFATAHGVDDLFVSVPDGLATSSTLDWYRSLRPATQAAGIRVQALGSETTWIDRPKAALAWQSSALSTGLFDGVHLDVEPWIHPGWDGSRKAVATAWLGLLDSLARATRLPVEADLAFWLDQVTVQGTRLDRAAIARVDAVTVLTYRHVATGPDSITGLGATALAAAAKARKPARLAVETNDLGDDAVARKQTFFGRTAAELAQVLGEVDDVEAAAGAGASTYRGIAVHDHLGWAALAD
ncbi:hypothetical protein H5V45_18655 [Nocardioides sp. KIGAM211]|uniref:Uncharacterized protein n=1 Tax=Nocardioides luti TaxID=2761101 RepID=A0A7X0VCC4_9ACTN|nr:hypothetical protein [Nocardioides luti]MBB6629355.1 hypothetical protein [Nocardioides luti]